MTPVFAHGALRLYLLSLLVEGPKHGYELIQALEQRFGGTYRPSAGTIYPRLAKLEGEGLVTKTTAGRTSTYAITPEGREHLHERENELTSLEDDITDSVKRLADEVRGGVKDAMRALKADLAVAARDAASARRPVFESDRPAQPSNDARAATRTAVHDVDVALAEFRSAVRGSARTARALSTEQSAAIRRELDDALVRIGRIVGGR